MAGVARIHVDEETLTSCGRRRSQVRKAEESEGSRSSGSIKGKRQITKKVLEYCYEPEMVEAYRTSMLKAFKKTLDEGIFIFIIGSSSEDRDRPEDFWFGAPKKGIMVFALPGEPSLTELAGDFKIHFHDRQGEFYCLNGTYHGLNPHPLHQGD
ncbi:hypothetical protein QJS10_CPA05g01524 [Acorus calamus]|uniref:PTEN2A/B C2 domain-containing protein n=1 Tax=Acorus calamus TaxID=4465 RepID=A0AAV9EVR6_ACOCL|nr:hypothetical protein QJS10_CPA05g01524 [Acorus calamus]